MEPGEEPRHALVRELREELDLAVDSNELIYLGSFSAPAANEPEYFVQAEVFRIDIATAVQPAAEIEEIVWIMPSNPDGLKLAPLTRDYILRLCAV